MQKGEQHQPRRPTNHHKLSFPEYNGNEEPSQWLYKCNKFFVAQNTKEEEQMHLVAFHLQGDILIWFIRWEQEIGHPNWPQFSKAIDRRFGPPLHHNHLGDLTNTCQLEELDKYANQFLLTLTKVTGLSTAQQVMMYTAGLASTL
jgi:hypothetical protein